MVTDVLDRARNFMRTAHQLSPEETEETLGVAASVLSKGLGRLDTALTADDSHTCVECAHSLKGNLLNLGLRELATAAARAMEQAQTGNLVPAREVHQTLSTVLRPILTLPAH